VHHVGPLRAVHHASPPWVVHHVGPLWAVHHAGPPELLSCAAGDGRRWWWPAFELGGGATDEREREREREIERESTVREGNKGEGNRGRTAHPRAVL